MKSELRLLMYTVFFVITFIVFVFMNVQITTMEASVVGWGYNTTRNTSQYVIKNSTTAHIMSEHFCDRETFLLVMVCSAPANIEARSAIRDTWGSKRTYLGKNVSLFFLIGETANLSIHYDIILESERYGDIIQERFVDSYNNLTLKSVIMLKLVSNLCANSTKYLLKIDDDMFVNLHLIVEMLQLKNITSNLLIGKLICGARPIKDISSKWYSPNYMYSGRVYPNYLSGTGYLMSVDVAEKLYNQALKTPIFHLEDVFLTGICSKLVRLKPKNNPFFTYQKLNFDPCLYRKLFTIHRFNPLDIRRTYTILKEYDLPKECAMHKNLYIMNNLLKNNKTKRKSKCE